MKRNWNRLVPMLLLTAATGALLGQGSGGFVATGSMNVARNGHTATLLSDGRVLIAGGAGQSASALITAEIYNPANGVFTQTGQMSVPRNGHTATLLNDGTVLIAGGSDGNNNSLDSAEIYRPSTGTFTRTGSMLTAQFGHSATLLANGKVLIAGGEAGPPFPTAVPAEMYDPATGTFSLAAAYTNPNSLWPGLVGPLWPTATLLPNGKILLAGNNPADLYNPAIGQFGVTGEMTAPDYAFGMYWHTATLLANGRVLVAGGSNDDDILNAAQLYDPSTNRFSSTGPMTTRRALHTATLLKDGSILITGGEGDVQNGEYTVFGGSLDSAERYDPGSGAFVATGSMMFHRSGHTATLLQNGSVLIAGGIVYQQYTAGSVNTPSVLSSAELYAAQPVAAQNLVLDRSTLSFGYSGSLITSPQSVNISFSNGASVAWTASSTQPNIVVSPNSGNGPGTIQITAFPGPSGTIALTESDGGGVRQILVNVTPAAGFLTPFGGFDTPIDNANAIAGAIPVTGWALDSIEVAKVDIWRESVAGEGPGTGPNGLIYVGDAVFVPGARPDVQSANANAPLNYRAGWGYLLLTNLLPNSSGAGAIGNGMYKLHAIAHNKTGVMQDLGVHTISVDNQHASKPFGTIDTPAQGATLSGKSFVNFGWALTQNPYQIPADGSTITVYIDGQPMTGHPVYNQFRNDIATLFPGLQNSMGSVGYYALDTTQLANGLHTISWTVYDNQNRGDGIGSRFFNVVNTGVAAAAPAARAVASVESLNLRLDEQGFYRVDTEETGRIELRLGAVAGRAMVDGEVGPLPAGSSLRDGVFFWEPGPGFLGDHHLVFTLADGTSLTVRVRIKP